MEQLVTVVIVEDQPVITRGGGVLDPVRSRPAGAAGWRVGTANLIGRGSTPRREDLLSWIQAE
jgi:hypothetical protein